MPMPLNNYCYCQHVCLGASRRTCKLARRRSPAAKMLERAMYQPKVIPNKKRLERAKAKEFSDE